MDPNACCKLLASAMHEHEWDDARDTAADLIQWLRTGGFSPDAAHVALVGDRLAYVLECLTERDEHQVVIDHTRMVLSLIAKPAHS